MDVLIYETGNGGDVSIKNGDIEMTNGLFNQPYLAHFGGNVEANTEQEYPEGVEREDWLGNVFINNESNRFNSNLERAIKDNNLTSQGRSVIEVAAKNDLQYLEDIAEVNSFVSVIGLNKLSISDTIKQKASDIANAFKYIFDGTRNEVIETRII